MTVTRNPDSPKPQGEADRGVKPAEPRLPVSEEDVDPLEGGGPAPGSPPGETFGSVATVPMSEAERNERAGHKRSDDPAAV